MLRRQREQGRAGQNEPMPAAATYHPQPGVTPQQQSMPEETSRPSAEEVHSVHI
jgi:hypothetical protein